ncbi:hypothetical protein EV648_1146 [Kribbella sp. VKM Ac-2568]|nr:hypothetical protein EV648_1146 [Kribbella sp. VKM Ac-2568]
MPPSKVRTGMPPFDAPSTVLGQMPIHSVTAKVETYQFHP